MRSCTKCQRQFERGSPRSHASMCQSCETKRISLYRKSHPIDQHGSNLKYRTRYPWISVLHNARRRCTDQRNMAYGGKGIKCFLSAKEIEYIWKRDQAIFLKEPSIDRINNAEHYTIENCRFIEMKENLSRRTFSSK